MWIAGESPAGGTVSRTVVAARRAQGIAKVSRAVSGAVRAGRALERRNSDDAECQAVRLEFPILSLHPGLRPRCVAVLACP